MENVHIRKKIADKYESLAFVFPSIPLYIHRSVFVSYPFYARVQIFYFYPI